MRVLFLVAALLLAGCGEPAEPSRPTTTFTRDEGAIRDFEDPEHHCVAGRDPDRVHAPDLEGNPWIIGQYWDYALAVDDGEEVTTRLVYYEDQDRGQHYMVGTQTREEALRHVVASVNPMIGRIHARLYSPHESGDHADMFHFPLCSGSSWQTVFYGETFSLTAQEADVAVPGLGLRPGFVISGRSAEGSTLTHTYALDAQWFTRLDLVRADGGAVRMRLDAMGDGHTGPAYFLRGQQDVVLDLAGAAAADQTVVPREDGREGPYDTIAVALSMERTAGTGLARLELAAPNGTVMASAEVGDTGVERVEFVREVPYASGGWTLTRVTLPPGPLGPTVAGELRLVSVYDRSGSV